MTECIGVIGLGDVGLPIALPFARRVPHTVGFDINSTRVAYIGPVLRASATVGAALRHGSGYASTAFEMGYSPQRINPDDREHSFVRWYGAFFAANTFGDTQRSRPDVHYWSL